MAKSKAEQHEQSVELADVWSDPPVEEIGSPTRTLSNKAYLRELASLQVELVKQLEWIKHRACASSWSSRGAMQPARAGRSRR